MALLRTIIIAKLQFLKLRGIAKPSTLDSIPWLQQQQVSCLFAA
jgi:hypothetical protein